MQADPRGRSQILEEHPAIAEPHAWEEGLLPSSFFYVVYIQPLLVPPRPLPPLYVQPLLSW